MFEILVWYCESLYDDVEVLVALKAAELEIFGSFTNNSIIVPIPSFWHLPNSQNYPEGV